MANMKEKIVTYFDETVVELKKTAWPSKDEVRGSTVVVIVTSILLSIVIFAIDWVISLGVRTLLG